MHHELNYLASVSSKTVKSERHCRIMLVFVTPLKYALVLVLYKTYERSGKSSLQVTKWHPVNY